MFLIVSGFTYALIESSSKEESIKLFMEHFPFPEDVEFNDEDFDLIHQLTTLKECFVKVRELRDENIDVHLYVDGVWSIIMYERE